MPGWTPHSVFDVGAKINNVLWSAKAIWGDEIKDYTCVEDRTEMVASSKELSTDMGVNFARQLQLTSDPDAKKRKVAREPFVSADLTVCAFHLGNIGEKRKNLYLRELWKRTDNILVLIDSSFGVISDAREFLLREYPDCTVLAPCGHDKACPMLRQTRMTGTPHECFFSQRFMRAFSPVRSPIRETPQDVVHERFSYLVLRRKGSFNLVLPPNTDETDEPPLEKKKKASVKEEEKTAEELEYEAKLAEIEKQELEKLAAMTKEEIKAMFAITRPSRDTLVMPVEEEAQDEFTKGWYSEEEDGEATPELPEGVVSTKAAREASEAEAKQARENSPVADTQQQAQEGEEGSASENEELDRIRRLEEENEDLEDIKEEIDYVPRRQWYSRRWARVVSPPEKRVRHLALSLCTPDGELDTQILGKSQPSYKLARNMKWGDLWGYPKPPKSEQVADHSWSAKNKQRKQWKAEGVWEQKKQEINKRQEQRKAALIRRGIVDPLEQKLAEMDKKKEKKAKKQSRSEK